MAQRKIGKSPHTRRRHALQRLAELEARQAKLERSRPRTPAKRGWRTRRLTTVAHQIRAARGQLTRALRAIAQAARTRTTAKAIAKEKRGAAARKAWGTRRARKPAPAPGKAIPFLTAAGVVYVWPPARSDRSKVASHWNAIDTFLSTGSSALLDRFAGDGIYDEISGESLRFVIDPRIIIAHSDQYDFGVTFYRDRREVSRFAA